MTTWVRVVLLILVAGCASRAPAPVDERRGAPAPAPKPPVAQPVRPAAPQAGTYVVKRGDTLYSIALELGVDYRDLARWNRIEDPSKLRVGQALQVSESGNRAAAPVAGSGVSIGAARGAGAVESRPLDRPAATPPVADAGMKDSPKAVRLPYSEQNLALLSKGDGAVAAPAPKPAAPAAPVLPVTATVAPKPEPPKPEAPKPEAQKPEAKDPESLEFLWPAKGRVIAGFSEPNNKGIDIAGKAGDAVIAAAGGRVIYTGSGIRGLGKLIVIRHDNNFQSVYAHNREILVKEGQTVTRGQKIAELGETDSDTPKLHFEIRKSGRPVDPARYLPSG